jgi:predicted ATPase
MGRHTHRNVMKIRKLYFGDGGPLSGQEIALDNDWSGEIETRVLLSGPNGCGKSTILRSVAMLWLAFGYWLDSRKAMPRDHLALAWLQRQGGCAVVLDGVTTTDQSVGLIFGDSTWCSKIKFQHPDAIWIGEEFTLTVKKTKRELFGQGAERFQNWSKLHNEMVLSFAPTELPNVVFLSSEDRRWVSPRKNIGAHLAEQPELRWLPSYIATEHWKGQLEASLIALRVTEWERYRQVIQDLNQFLVNKEIDPVPTIGDNRIRVKIGESGDQFHLLDELSTGEHQVLILIYFLSRWAQQGCVVLIDEPDLNLHPSRVSGLLAVLEQIVGSLNGQLLITSHRPDSWQRYEVSGKLIQLRASSDKAAPNRIEKEASDNE